jgi:hypothetical protein
MFETTRPDRPKPIQPGLSPEPALAVPNWMNQIDLPKRLGHTPSRLPTIHLSKSVTTIDTDNFRHLSRSGSVTGERDLSVNFTAVNRVLRIFQRPRKTRLTTHKRRQGQDISARDRYELASSPFAASRWRDGINAPPKGVWETVSKSVAEQLAARSLSLPPFRHSGWLLTDGR